MKRKRMHGASSKRYFKAGAGKVHKYNLSTGNPMRGGIRL